MSGGMSRRKGQHGERELAALVRDLTGWDVRRRVRQHNGDSDLVGIPNWSLEVKRRKAAGRADIRAWWDQTVAQAGALLPCLIYRLDRDQWRACWPLAIHLGVPRADYWRDYALTVESSLEGWAAAVRELAAAGGAGMTPGPSGGPDTVNPRPLPATTRGPTQRECSPGGA